MPRVVAIGLFLTFALSLLGGLHYYYWARLVRDAAWPAPWPTLGSAFFLLGFLSLPGVFFIGRLLPPAWSRLAAWPAFTWMGMILVLFLCVASFDLARALTELFLARGAPADPTRRLLLARLAAGATLGASGILGVLAVRNALGRIAVRDLEIHLPRLPAALDGTTVVQLTDIHVGPTIGRSFIEELVRRTNALGPDLVAITGDLVDGSVEQLAAAVAPLAELRARHGVFFVTGNHEYYSGVDQWISELGRLGLRVLRNERVSIGSDAHSFDLAGVDDFSSHGFAPGHGADLARAVAGRDPTRELLLLAHQPRAVLEAARHGVGLQLSGHTHGGQIWPFGYAVRLQQRWLTGLYRELQTQLYVSPGTGYWGPPMRLGTTAEITKIVLRSTG